MSLISRFRFHGRRWFQFTKVHELSNKHSSTVPGPALAIAITPAYLCVQYKHCPFLYSVCATEGFGKSAQVKILCFKTKFEFGSTD